ncbi:FtsW/RodA/SpoVE family cell cycle protein [Tuberibacillus sp. Marseille-P3662]|uniref:FtsW/RodA/SpoVE family cell cycle protein n=1 Tax=Tuberibacillus sp. Marseille-P3662 TaxID=1965358 RepID=UPI000A1CCEB6|nr:FtsW/RodA/SpoVE family cell cycle protein [Tuberibacillus sp. Marseille-P3662]
MSQNDPKLTTKIDYTLIFVVFLLGLTSLIAISQAPDPDGNLTITSVIQKQILWYVVGSVVCVVVFIFDYDKLQNLAWFVYGFVLLLLVSLIAFKLGIPVPFAHESNGAYSWFQLPGIGTIQPAEFMKVALIIALGQIIYRHRDTYDHPSGKQDLLLVGKIFITAFPPFALVLIQPDLGTALILFAITFFLIFVSGIRWRWLLMMITLVILGVALFFYLFFNHPDILNTILEKHQLNRFSAWLNPNEYSNNIGYQLLHSLTSIGSGQLYGRGIESTSVILPFGHTDFIFAVIAGHFGFFGASVVISLLFMLIYRIVNAALATHDPFGTYICTGIIGMLTFTIFENIGMTLQVMPITGIPLPFLSYGGSALLNNMIAIGLVLSIEARSRRYMFD